jgi:hypothetical protein
MLSLMREGRALGWAGLCVALGVMGTPACADVPAGWTAQDIGGAMPPGATTYSEDGVWGLKGGGAGVTGAADQFQFAFHDLKGDGSFTARLMTLEGGDAKQARAGVMLREGADAGARNLFVALSAGRQGLVTVRPETGAATQELADHLFPHSLPIYLRVQRVGTELQGFASTDGRLWRALAGPRTVNVPETVQVGLGVSSHADGQLAATTLDNVALEPGLVSPTGLTACGGDSGALLTWRPVRQAAGYLVYRGPLDATADKLQLLTTSPIPNASYMDAAPGLTNGTPVLYAVSPVFKRADGSLQEGHVTATATTPTNAHGFAACSIAEPAGPPGHVELDAATGTLTVTAAGSFIGGRADRFFMADQSTSGDFQVTVKLLANPAPPAQKPRPARPDRNLPRTEPSPPPAPPADIQAGLMIRESLEPGSRFFYAYVSPAQGAGLLWRGVSDEAVESPGATLIDRDKVPSPLWLRLTRAGNTISAFSSTDGTTFKPLGDPYPFADNLPGSLHVGLAVTAGVAGRPGQARFAEFKVEPR